MNNSFAQNQAVYDSFVKLSQRQARLVTAMQQAADANATSNASNNSAALATSNDQFDDNVEQLIDYMEMIKGDIIQLVNTTEKDYVGGAEDDEAMRDLNEDMEMQDIYPEDDTVDINELKRSLEEMQTLLSETETNLQQASEEYQALQDTAGNKTKLKKKKIEVNEWGAEVTDLEKKISDVKVRIKELKAIELKKSKARALEKKIEKTRKSDKADRSTGPYRALESRYKTMEDEMQKQKSSSVSMPDTGFETDHIPKSRLSKYVQKLLTDIRHASNLFNKSIVDNLVNLTQEQTLALRQVLNEILDVNKDLYEKNNSGLIPKEVIGLLKNGTKTFKTIESSLRNFYNLFSSVIDIVRPNSKFYQGSGITNGGLTGNQTDPNNITNFYVVGKDISFKPTNPNIVRAMLF